MIANGEEGARVPGAERIIATPADLPQSLSHVGDMPVFKEASYFSLELQ
jgi:hypothetical protein